MERRKEKCAPRTAYKSNDFSLPVVFVLCVISLFVLRFLAFWFILSFSLILYRTLTHLQLKTMSEREDERNRKKNGKAKKGTIDETVG